MPIEHRIDPTARLVTSAHIGIVPDDEFLRSYRELFQRPGFSREFDHFVDLRQTTSAVRSVGALRQLAEFMKAQYRKGVAALPRTAIVAPQDISFGLSRLYEALTDALTGDVAVFREVDEARAWLGRSVAGPAQRRTGDARQNG